MSTQVYPSSTMSILLFSLDEQYFGLTLALVERVVLMVEITPIPEVSDKLLGIINVQGNIMPVLNLRAFWGLSTREFSVSDQLIIILSKQQRFALWVDCVIDLVEYSEEELFTNDTLISSHPYSHRVFKWQDKLIFILEDIDRLLEEVNISEQTLTKR